jgi:hypothetical protein
MRVLDELERELARIAHAAGDVRPTRRWWRSSALLVLLPLGIATVAVGAVTSGILQGEPVKNPPGLHLNPKSGLGVIVGRGKLLSVRAADPAGGPPWALRMVKTSRGFGCVQLGRVVDGKLGVLGRDGSLRNDGKFHERGAEIIGQSDCQQTDGAGHTFIAISYLGMPESADAIGCVARDYGGADRPVCPPGSLRTIFYGLLGPEATAVSYRDGSGQVVRAPVSRPEGAYVAVRPVDPKRKNFYFAPGVSPASGLLSVEYRDGSTCELPHPPHGCPLKGYVAPKLTPVSHQQLATTVHVRVGARAEHPGPKVKGRTFPAQRRVTITFRARVAGDARSFYTVETQMLHGRKNCQGGTGGAVAKDVKAGTVLTRTLWVPYHCRNRMRIDVGYAQPTTPSPMPFMVGPLGDDKVGSTTVKLG